MVVSASRPGSQTSDSGLVSSSVPSEYEAQTQAIARQLLQDSGKGKKSIFSKMKDQLKWDDKLLGWTMENPGLRVQMFRLIDCLPALSTKADIASHLQEYLGDESVELPQGAERVMLNLCPIAAFDEPTQVASDNPLRVSGGRKTLANRKNMWLAEKYTGRI